MITLYHSSHGTLQTDSLTVEEARQQLSVHLAHSLPESDEPGHPNTMRSVLWVDFSGATKEELRLLSEVFGFPELCVEDCEHPQEIPKMEEYPDCLFLVVFAVKNDEEQTDRFKQRELDLFITQHLLVTIHAEPLSVIEHMQTQLKRGSCSIEGGAVAMANELLDTLVDMYSPVLDQMENALLSLEDQLLEKPDEPVEHRFFALQRSLLKLRQLSLKHQDLFYWLSHRNIQLISREQALQFKDIYDHMSRIAELSDASRQMLAGMLSIHLSMVSNRLNDVMRVLTMFSAILLPLTFIVGVYGMNFRHFPELDWPYGYPLVWTVMLSIAIGMLTYFKKKRWW